MIDDVIDKKRCTKSTKDDDVMMTMIKMIKIMKNISKHAKKGKREDYKKTTSPYQIPRFYKEKDVIIAS